ncbi:MAG: DUF1540 domain-containing protein [Eubacterium sp.]|nr:DUF1540 domain-containing protein [Eubacterium sp.]
MDKKIEGITCDAKNCIYHDKAEHCTAGHINVGCHTAKEPSETKCETFECCKDCK